MAGTLVVDNKEDFIQRAETTVGKPDRFNARWIKSVELNRPWLWGLYRPAEAVSRSD